MKLPALTDPGRYTGLYIVDFGDQVAVGYTAPEVEVLLDHEAYRSCKVFKIHNAYPDGRMELIVKAGRPMGMPTARRSWRMKST